MSDIEKKEDAALATGDQFKMPESIGDFDQSDLQLSNIFICQDQSSKAREEGVMPGNLYDSMTFEQWDILELIMCYQFNTRILYGENTSDPLKCYSPNAKFPTHPTPISPNCVECPENIKPTGGYGLCNRIFNFACIIPKANDPDGENDFPLLLPMQRFNAPVAKKLLNISLRMKKELFYCTRAIKTKSTKNDKGTFFTFDISKMNDCTPEDLERARFWMQFLMEMNKQQKISIDNAVDDADVPF